MAALTNLIERTDSIAPQLVGAVPDQETDSGPISVPVYQVQSFAPEVESGQLQKLYGTSAMPMFEFARRVQSGEATFDPSKQFDREAADVIGSLSDQELAAQGLQPDIKDMLIPAAEAAVGAVIGTAGSMASTLPGGGTSSEFFSQIGPAAKSYIPGAGTTLSAGAKALGLKAGEVGVPLSDAGQLMQGGAKVTSAPISFGGTNYVKMNAAQVDAAQGNLAALGKTYSGAGGSTISGPPLEPGMFEAGGFFDTGFTGYTPSFGQVSLGFGISLGANLLGGMSPKEAIKGAAFSTAGTAIGTAVGGPIGGFIGGTIGSIIGRGSVVCTELHAQGEISHSEYRTTNYYTATMLTPTLVKGYHFWGVPAAEKMKKGKQIKFWKAVYKQWLKHANYKLGKGKFSLPGFVVGNSLETASLLLGKIYEATLEKRIFAHG